MKLISWFFDIFVRLSFSRWSVMTYEVPATAKHTLIVKEDDSLDCPLQVKNLHEAVSFVTGGIYKLDSQKLPKSKNDLENSGRLSGAWELG